MQNNDYKISCLDFVCMYLLRVINEIFIMQGKHNSNFKGIIILYENHNCDLCIMDFEYLCDL